MNKQLYNNLRSEYPWYSFLFYQHDGSVRLYGSEAIKAANILGRTNMGIEENMATIELNQDEIHYALPKMIRIGCQFKVFNFNQTQPNATAVKSVQSSK